MAANKSTLGHRQRLRERFLAEHSRALSDEGLAELLLTFAIPQKDVLPLARALIERFGSAKGLLEASPDALREVKGVGEATVVLIRLVARFAAQRPRRPAATPRLIEQPLFPAEFSDGPPAASVAANTNGLPASATRRSRRRVATAPVRTAQRTAPALFSNALLKEAIALVPRLPDTESLDEVRTFLRSALHQSSEQTRERYAQYIARRLFPPGVADRAMRLFARSFAGTGSLADVVFYRFTKAEPVVEQCVGALLIPAMGRGTLPRVTIRHYLIERFPGARSALIEDTARAIVQALEGAGIARTERQQVAFRWRDVCPRAFAFVLHSEFPRPGMYDVGQVETARAFQALLWRPDALVHALYELRNRGWIAKVSEIDSVRQFTTIHDLEGLVGRMAGEEVTP
jgi:DNA repair protein RadC